MPSTNSRCIPTTAAAVTSVSDTSAAKSVVDRPGGRSPRGRRTRSRPPGAPGSGWAGGRVMTWVMPRALVADVIGVGPGVRSRPAPPWRAIIGSHTEARGTPGVSLTVGTAPPAAPPRTAAPRVPPRPCSTCTIITEPNRPRSRVTAPTSSAIAWPITTTRAPPPTLCRASADRRRLAVPSVSTTARCSSMACMWAWPRPNPESVPPVVMSRSRSRRTPLATTIEAAADTAASKVAGSCAARRTSTSTVVRPCHGCSCWRTSISSWRADDGQCTRRRSSPTT